MYTYVYIYIYIYTDTSVYVCIMVSGTYMYTHRLMYNSTITQITRQSPTSLFGAIHKIYVYIYIYIYMYIQIVYYIIL